MKDKNNIDNLFRSKLYSYQVKPDGSEQIWDSISKRLKYRKQLLATLCACAAAIVAFYFTMTPIVEKPYTQDSIELSYNYGNNYELIESSTIAALAETQTIIKTSNITSNKTNPSTKIVKNRSEYVADLGVVNNSYEKDISKECETETVSQQESPVSKKRVAKTVDFIDYERSFFEDDDFLAKRKKGTSISLNSNVLQGAKTDNRGERGISMMSGGSAISEMYMERISDVKYSLPINFGVQVQFRITDFLGVGVGLNYSYNKSKYDVLINKKMGEVKQNMHYIGIPVNFYGNLLRKNGFNLYANAGFSADKLLRTSYDIRYYDGATHINNTSKSIEWAVNFGLGVEYTFVDFAGIYLEPNAVYFFNAKTPYSIRKDQPFQLKAEIGLRFHF